MTELKVYVLMLEICLVCLGLLLAILAALKLKVVNATLLFIWGCSVPLAVTCYAVWIYASGGDWWGAATLLISIFLLAQLGWVGGALAFASVLIKVKAVILRKMALWISIVSVTCHGLFLAQILFLDMALHKQLG